MKILKELVALVTQEWRAKRARDHEVQDWTEWRLRHSWKYPTAEEFAEYRRKKYNPCQNCGCTELFHKDGLLRSWCELCTCERFVQAPINCRSTYRATLDERCAEIRSEMFPGEEQELH